VPSLPVQVLRSYTATFLFPAEGGQIELTVPGAVQPVCLLCPRRLRTPTHANVNVYVSVCASMYVYMWTGETAIGKIKEELWRQRTATSSSSSAAGAKALGPPDRYAIKYTDQDGLAVELLDEDQPLSSVAILPVWATQLRPLTFTVEQRRAASRQDKSVGAKIGVLIDYGMFQLDQVTDLEVNAFRRKMVRVRRLAIKERKALPYLFSPAYEPTEMPPRCVCTLFPGTYNAADLLSRICLGIVLLTFCWCVGMGTAAVQLMRSQRRSGKSACI
jgi:hypothetical protein